MAHIILDTPHKRNKSRRSPQYIIRECRECGGHPIGFADEQDLWAAVYAFTMEGWAAMRDGNSVRVWWANVQEGTA